MTEQQKQIKEKALALTRRMTTIQLIEGFRGTNKSTNIQSMDVQFVRGCFMDVLEERDPEAFEAWMDCEDLELMEDPGNFFNIN